MNRKQRRADRVFGKKISDLPEEPRKVICALIKHWLLNTECGRDICERQGMSIEQAVDCICELHDKGLARLRFGPGTPLKDAPFYIDPIVPMGGWEGSRA